MNSAASQLSLGFIGPEALAGRPSEWWARVLGVAVFGGALPDCIPVDVPAVAVDAPPFGGPPLCEVWSAGAPVRSGSQGRLRYRCDDTLLFGCLELEPGAADIACRGALHGATERAYGEVFAAIDALGYPSLWRVWNYVPRINLEVEGGERYWQFNSGRQDAFLAGGRTTEGEVPAACALGTQKGPAVVYFLALREAPLALENPRQTAAYHYPEQYGPRSPTFSRASIARLGGDPVLFVSGTASIVGHETRHHGDAVAQARETLCNIEAVVDEAGRRMAGAAFSMPCLIYRVYVRNEADYPAVREVVRERLGPGAVVEYVRADVCRRDLLVEIEASGGHGVEWTR